MAEIEKKPNLYEEECRRTRIANRMAVGVFGGGLLLIASTFSLQFYLGVKYDLFIKPKQESIKSKSQVERVLEQFDTNGTEALEREELSNFLKDYQLVPVGE